MSEDYCNIRECEFWEYGDVCTLDEYPQLSCPEREEENTIIQERLK